MVVYFYLGDTWDSKDGLSNKGGSGSTLRIVVKVNAAISIIFKEVLIIPGIALSLSFLKPASLKI